MTHCMRCSLSVLLYLALIGWAVDRVSGEDDLVVADFESPSYGSWEVTGDAFGSGPASGTLPHQMHVEGYLGQRLINSYNGGDDSVGTLTSPEFRLERNYLAFLIGGGQNAESLALQLLVDGKVVRSATGNNNQPGGSETLTPQSWDVRELAGQTVRLRIIDQAKGGWGHINVDHIVQTNKKPAGLLRDAERSMKVTAKYLHFPIRNGARKRSVTLLVGDQKVVRNDIELADQAPDWWAPMDVSAWKGGTITVRVDQLSEDSAALASLEFGDTVKDSENLYREGPRGQFHFSPRRGWNNDPNGMVYYRGEYHLFFQHNPYGWGWGNMHWGHAVSKDMVHWQELGDVLLPDDLGPMFSGSAVVDWNNTSGFGKGDHPPLVLIYTAAGNPTTQCIAYSNDGRTFTKYEGNPVLPQITGGNRDPKVFWHAPTQHWVMVLYVEWQGKHTIHFFTSPNLREWQFASMTEGDAVGSPYLFECPDFFELPIDGDNGNKKWVLLAANSAYAIGTFDGVRFLPEASNLPGHLGRGFYAPQTFSDIPEHDGRRIQIGWWQTETRGAPFNQSMTVPLALGLRSTPKGPRLTFAPVKELESLRESTSEWSSFPLEPGQANPLDEQEVELVELRAEIDPGTAEEIVFNVRDIMVVYFPKQQELRVDDRKVAAPLIDGRLRLAVYCDRTGAEVFASDGLCYVPLPFTTNPDHRKLYLESRGGTATIRSMQVYKLRSSWVAP